MNEIERIKHKIKTLQIKGDDIKKKMDSNSKEIVDLIRGPHSPQREIRFKMLMDSTRKLGNELTNITNEIKNYTTKLKDIS